MIQAGVDPAVFCREARFFRAVAQANTRHHTEITTVDVLAQEEIRKAATTIVDAAESNTYAHVTHNDIGPDEVDALQFIAHTWLLQLILKEEVIARIQTLIEVLHENEEELNVDDLPDVLGDDA